MRHSPANLDFYLPITLVPHLPTSHPFQLETLLVSPSNDDHGQKVYVWPWRLYGGSCKVSPETDEITEASSSSEASTEESESDSEALHDSDGDYEGDQRAELEEAEAEQRQEAEEEGRRVINRGRPEGSSGSSHCHPRLQLQLQRLLENPRLEEAKSASEKFQAQFDLLIEELEENLGAKHEANGAKRLLEYFWETLPEEGLAGFGEGGGSASSVADLSQVDMAMMERLLRVIPPFPNKNVSKSGPRCLAPCRVCHVSEAAPHKPFASAMNSPCCPCNDFSMLPLQCPLHVASATTSPCRSCNDLSMLFVTCVQLYYGPILV